MPQMIDEADPFMTLLTEALRAGPGSPEWHEAILTIGQSGGDEYKAILQARENLQSGRAYREVRPGPAFSRKVMEGLVEPRSRRWSTPTIVASLSCLVIAAIIAGAAYVLWHGGNGDTTAVEVAALSDQVFLDPGSTTDFSTGISHDWKPFGVLPVIAAKGLRPAPLPDATGSATQTLYRGGGLVSVTPIPAERAISLDVQLRINHSTDSMIAQIFITDDPHFDGDRATTPHELVCMIESKQAQVVLPDGRLASSALPVKEHEPVTIRMVVGRNAGLVDVAGRRLWSGPHQLDPAKPRYVGIRFLRSTAKGDGIVVDSVRLQQQVTQ